MSHIESCQEHISYEWKWVMSRTYLRWMKMKMKTSHIHMRHVHTCTYLIKKNSVSFFIWFYFKDTIVHKWRHLIFIWDTFTDLIWDMFTHTHTHIFIWDMFTHTHTYSYETSSHMNTCHIHMRQVHTWYEFIWMIWIQIFQKFIFIHISFTWHVLMTWLIMRHVRSCDMTHSYEMCSFVTRLIHIFFVALMSGLWLICKCTLFWFYVHIHWLVHFTGSAQREREKERERETHTHTHTHTNARARTHTRTQTHTHTNAKHSAHT